MPVPAKGPYLSEVTRIILKEHPYGYGPKVVVLVSARFAKEAGEYVKKTDEIYGAQHNGPTYLRLRGSLISPAPWLSDYEFEIRPPA